MRRSPSPLIPKPSLLQDGFAETVAWRELEMASNLERFLRLRLFPKLSRRRWIDTTTPSSTDDLDEENVKYLETKGSGGAKDDSFLVMDIADSPNIRRSLSRSGSSRSLHCYSSKEQNQECKSQKVKACNLVFMNVTDSSNVAQNIPMKSPTLGIQSNARSKFGIIDCDSNFHPIITEDLLGKFVGLTTDDLCKFAEILKTRLTASLVVYQSFDLLGKKSLPLIRKLLPQVLPASETVFVLNHHLTEKLYSSQPRRHKMDEVMDVLSLASNCNGKVLLVSRNFSSLLEQLCFSVGEFAHRADTLIVEHIEHKIDELSDRADTSIKINVSSATYEGVRSLPIIRRKLAEVCDSVDVSMTFKQVVVLAYMHLYITQHAQPSIDWEKYIAITQAFYLDDEEAQTTLELFQYLGFAYVITNQKEHVEQIIVDIQWLFSMVDFLFAPPPDKESSLRRDWNHLSTTGCLTKELHDHLVSRAATVPGHALPSGWLFSLLEDLYLFSSSPEHQKSSICACYTPLLLPISHCKTESFSSQREISPVFFQLGNGSVPPGYLARLTTALTKDPAYRLKCSPSASTSVFQLQLHNHNCSYLVKFSERKRLLKVQFCSAANTSIDFAPAEEVSTYITRTIIRKGVQLQLAWPKVCPPFSEATHSDITIYPCTFLECCDARCDSRPPHLSRVQYTGSSLDNIPHVVCLASRDITYLRDLPDSQRIWMCASIQQGFSRPESAQLAKPLGPEDVEGSIDSEQDILFFELLSPSAKRKYALTQQSRAVAGSGMSDGVLLGNDNCACPFELMEDMSYRGRHTPEPDSTTTVFRDYLRRHKSLCDKLLPLGVVGYLYDYFLLEHSDFEYLWELNVQTKDWCHIKIQNNGTFVTHRELAVEKIFQIVEKAGLHGVMGLIAAIIKISEDKDDEQESEQCERLLTVLRMDPDYQTIETSWLQALVICNAEVKV